MGSTDFAISNPAMAQDEDDDEVDEVEQSIEQKLSVLAVEESGDGADNKTVQNGKQNKYRPPPASSLQQMLVQALHSNDSQLLEACLTHNNPEIIRNTVRRLPTTWVIPFLQQIVDKFQEKPNRGKVLLEWIKAVLLIHTAYLMTVSNNTPNVCHVELMLMGFCNRFRIWLVSSPTFTRRWMRDSEFSKSC